MPSAFMILLRRQAQTAGPALSAGDRSCHAEGSSWGDNAPQGRQALSPDPQLLSRESETGPGVEGSGATMWQQVRRVAAYAVNPLTMWAYLRIMRSNQPQRLFLPVVTPHSWPRFCSRSPISCVRTEQVKGSRAWPTLLTKPSARHSPHLASGQSGSCTPCQIHSP